MNRPYNSDYYSFGGNLVEENRGRPETGRNRTSIGALRGRCFFCG